MQTVRDSSYSQSAVEPILLSRQAASVGASFSHYLDEILSGALQVSFHFQPIVDLRRGIPAGYEALARFPPAMGPAPDVVFAAAGALGKRIALEAVVTRAAILSKVLLPPDTFLSINLSVPFLISRQWKSLLSTVADLAGFVIEITEEESVADYDAMRCALAHIRALGGSIAVDDAGSGYASLKHVVEMKPAFVKLDRMFVSRCDTDRAKAVLIEMMGQACDRLDAWVVAEGIETQQELEELIHLGVPLGQGYHLGRPQPAMLPLAADVAAAIRIRAQQQRVFSGLAPYLESCPLCATAQAARDLLASTDAAAVIVADKWNRPGTLIERHPLLGLREVAELMKTQLASDPLDSLYRALNRPPATRYDPIIVIDAKGDLQGLVSLDRLTRAMLDRSPATL